MCLNLSLLRRKSVPLVVLLYGVISYIRILSDK